MSSDSTAPAASELIRKRSRSSSPGADSPLPKKSNLDPSGPSGPSNLSTVDEDTKSVAAEVAAPQDAPNESTVVDADATAPMQTDDAKVDPAASNEEATPMNVDSDLPANPSATSESSAAADAAAAAAAVIQMRALIVTQDASIIIGKGGKNVNEIREKSGSKITITEAVPGNPERVMVIAGQLDAVSKAFGLVVRRINDEPFDVPSVPGSRAVTIRFIIPNARMGSVIGKSGSKIKEIQEASGARLQASEALLPGSTERVLSVSGVADAIHIAVYYIGTILQEHPSPSVAQHTTYRPAGGANSSYQAGGGGGSEYGGSRGGGGGGGGGGRPYGGAPSSGGGGGGPPPAALPGQQTQQIFIPNELVGSIIGKAGSKINEIRQLSQCQIKICEPGDGSPGANPAERLVTITGIQSGIQVAVRLLYTRLEQEKQKQLAGGV